jgi:hypothetical protein
MDLRPRNLDLLRSLDSLGEAFCIDFRVPGGLGGAMFWAFKDDNTNGAMVKTLAQGLGRP